MLSTEKTFEILPLMSDIYEKLDLETFRKNLIKENKGKAVDQNEIGITAFKYVLKNSAKVKQEFFEIISIVEEKTIEEVKAQSFIITMNSIKEIFSDKEVMSFFKSAVQ